MELIDTLSEFLLKESSYNIDQISQIESKLTEYSKCKLNRKYLLNQLEAILLGESSPYIGKLFALESKSAVSSIFTEPLLLDKQLWIILSVVSRINVFRRQAYFAEKKSFVADLSIHNILTLNNKGVLILKNFLEPSLHNSIMEELNSEPYALEKANTKNIKTNIPFISRFHFFKTRLKASGSILKNVSKIANNCGYTNGYWHARKLVYSSSFCQKINIKNNENDIQKDSHADTLFPSLKFWYFPYEVSINKSFLYAISSNKMSLNRMQIEADKIKTISNSIRNPYTSNISSSYKSQLEGSLRYSLAEIDQMGLSISPVNTPSNSLVLADVSGIHSRGNGEDEGTDAMRISIHGHTRHLKVF